MKKLVAFLLFTIICFQINAQDAPDITGIWQLKLDGKFVTGKSLGLKKAPYSGHNAYFLFTSDELFYAISPDKNLTRTKLDKLIDKQLAGAGDFLMYADLESVPEDERSRFNDSYPANTFFVVGDVQGEKSFFYYEPLRKKFLGAKRNPQAELVRVGSFKE
jgi:hypothetical protein